MQARLAVERAEAAAQEQQASQHKAEAAEAAVRRMEATLKEQVRGDGCTPVIAVVKKGGPVVPGLYRRMGATLREQVDGRCWRCVPMAGVGAGRQPCPAACPTACPAAAIL